MNALVSPAPIGHNSASYKEMTESDPAIIYRDADALPLLIKEIEADIAGMAVELKTSAGREAIASAAYKIAKRKTAILNAGKALTEGWRKQTAAVNSQKSLAETELDALRDRARLPLTKWEDEQKARREHIASVLAMLRSAANISASDTIQSLSTRIEELDQFTIGEDLGDELDAARKLKAIALDSMRAGRERLREIEAERAELARLRAEREETERASREAEMKRQAEQRERDLIEAAERRAAAEAEARIKAQADAAIEAEREKTRAAERALEAEAQRQRESDERRSREVRAEAERLEAERLIEERRAADIKHRSSVMRAVKGAMMEHGGIDEEAAKKIVLAIIAGAVPHTTISF